MNHPGDTTLKHPQYVYLKRKLEDLEEVHRDGKRQHLDEVGRLKADHERIRKANKEQAEQIARLKKHNELTETKVQDLKKNSISAHAEVRELRIKLRDVEAERERLTTRHAQADSAEARKKKSAAEAEVVERERRIAELTRALAVEKARAGEAETRARDERIKAEKEGREARTRNVLLEQRLERMRAELVEAESSQASTSGSLSARVGELEATLRRTAEAYGHLISSSAQKEAYESLKLEVARLRVYVARLERKVGNSDEQVYELANYVRQAQATNSLLSEELREAKQELSWRTQESTSTSYYLPHSTDDITLKSDIDAFLLDSHLSKEDIHNTLYFLAQNQLTLNHTTTQDLLAQLSSTSHALASERAEITRLTAKLSESTLVLTQVSKEGEAAKAAHAALSNTVSAHMAEIEALQTKLEESEKKVVAAESRVRTESARREEMLRKERELSGRLSSAVQQGKVAEEALREEIDQLAAELAGAEAYREAYESMAEEMRGLVARNDLAEDEADRLSRFNAEILSHSNPTQKIMYVDRIRRELADTKQKLVLSTREHEAALSESATLRDELAMYTSVAVPFEGKPRTAMTRVRRARVPLSSQKLNVHLESSQESMAENSKSLYPRATRARTRAGARAQRLASSGSGSGVGEMTMAELS